MYIFLIVVVLTWQRQVSNTSARVLQLISVIRSDSAACKVRITFLCFHVHCIHAMFLCPVVPSCVGSPLRCSNSFCSFRSPVPEKVPYSEAADSLILRACPLSRDKALPPESFRAVLMRHRDLFGMSRTPKHLQVRHSLCVFLLFFLTFTTNSV